MTGHPDLCGLFVKSREPLITFVYTWGIPSGAKARVDFAALTARLKSCPDTKPT